MKRSLTRALKKPPVNITTEVTTAMPSQAAASRQKSAIWLCARTVSVILSKIRTVPISPPETSTAKSPPTSMRRRLPRVYGQNERNVLRRYVPDSADTIYGAPPFGKRRRRPRRLECRRPSDPLSKSVLLHAAPPAPAPTAAVAVAVVGITAALVPLVVPVMV